MPEPTIAQAQFSGEPSAALPQRQIPDEPLGSEDSRGAVSIPGASPAIPADGPPDRPSGTESDPNGAPEGAIALTTAPMAHWFLTGLPETEGRWPNNPNGTSWFAEDDRYYLFAREPGRFVALGTPMGPTPRDVEVEAWFTKASGPPGGGYGIIVRDAGPEPRDGLSQHGRFYVFVVGDRGDFGVWRREGDEWIDIISWTPSEAVKPGAATNALRVVARGELMDFLINGRLVATVTDGTLPEGKVGIFVGGDFNLVVVELVSVMPVIAPQP
jgi:hypothetical protein